jgi:hypothetical protein
MAPRRPPKSSVEGMSMVSLLLSTTALEGESRLTVEYRVLYQITVF